MKTRDFDPVFSTALRNELEALADGSRTVAEPRDLIPRPRARGQIWITAGTALVVVLATVGVLRLTAPMQSAPAAAPSSAVIADPLQQITDPGDPAFVEPAPLVLLHMSGTGPGTFSVDVPRGVTSVRPLIRCAPRANFRISVGKAYWTWCSPQTTPGFADIPVSKGRHDLVLTIPTDVAWKLVVIASPGAGSGT